MHQKETHNVITESKHHLKLICPLQVWAMGRHRATLQ